MTTRPHIPTDELERLAEQITPGEWRTAGGSICAAGVTDTYSGTVWGSIATTYDLSQQDFEGRNWSASGDPSANAHAIALVPTLLRELIARRKADEWQPIATAPSDGTCILAYYRADEGVYDVCWDDALGWVSHDYEITNFMQSDLIAWRPLPPPPSTLTAGDSHDDQA